jgi:hypothetical protein
MCVAIAEPEDLVLIYFAGHTFVNERTGGGYLALVNTSFQEPTTGIHLPSLAQSILARSRAAHLLFILDCFQTGAMENAGRTSPYDFKPLLGPMLMHISQQQGNRLFFCSCRGNEVATEKSERSLGVFVYRMIVGLCGPASDPTTGNITLQQLHAFLASALGEQHRPHLFGKEQYPLVLVGDTPMISTPQQMPPSASAFSSTPSRPQNVGSQPVESATHFVTATAQRAPQPPSMNTGQQFSSQNLETHAIKHNIEEHLATTTVRENTQGRHQASSPNQKRSGPLSFFIGTGLQIAGMVIGLVGGILLILSPGLPVSVAFGLESFGMALLCVNAARGAYRHGIVRLLVVLLLSLVTAGILGAAYKFGYTRIITEIKIDPPLLVPVLLLAAWLALAAMLPLILAIGGYIGGLILGVRRRTR